MPKSEAGATKPARARARVKFRPDRLKLSGVSATSPLNTASLHDQLTARLRQMVLEGELRPGSPLPEKMLCETFGVSRTPLREGFKVLASEGLILLRPHRTPVVAPVDVAEVAAAFDVLVALDRMAGLRAAAAATPADVERIEAMHAGLVAHHRAGARPEYFRQNQDIHREITRLAGNPVLDGLWAGLSAKIYRARAQANLDPGRWDASLAEHERFTALFVAGRAEAFAEALAEHTALTSAAVVKGLKDMTQD